MYVAGPTILGAGKQIFDNAREQWQDVNINLPRSQSLIGLTDAEAQGRRIQNAAAQREYEAGERLVDLNSVHSKLSDIDPGWADYQRTLWQQHGIGVRTQDGNHYAKAHEMARFYDVASKDPTWQKGSVAFMKAKTMNEYALAKDEVAKAEAAMQSATDKGTGTAGPRAEWERASKRVADLEAYMQNIATADISMDAQSYKEQEGKTYNKTGLYFGPSLVDIMKGNKQGRIVGGSGADVEDLAKWQGIKDKVNDANKPFWYGQGISRILDDPKITGPVRSQLEAVLGTLNTAEGLKTAESLLNGLMADKAFQQKHGRVMELAAQFALELGMSQAGLGLAPATINAEAFRRAEAQVKAEDEFSREKLAGGALKSDEGPLAPGTPGAGGKRSGGMTPAPLFKTLPNAQEGAGAATNPGGMADNVAAPTQQPEPLAPGSEPPKKIQAPPPPPKPITPEKKPAAGAAAAPAKPTHALDPELGVLVTSDRSYYFDEDMKDRNTDKRGVWVLLTPALEKELAYREKMNKPFREAPGKIKRAFEAIEGERRRENQAVFGKGAR